MLTGESGVRVRLPSQALAWIRIASHKAFHTGVLKGCDGYHRRRRAGCQSCVSALVFQGARKPGFISHTSLENLAHPGEFKSAGTYSVLHHARETQLDETQSLRLVLRTTFNLC